MNPFSVTDLRSEVESMDWLHMRRHYRHVWNTRHWTDFRRGGTVFTRVRPFVCLFLCSWSGLRGKFSGDFSETLLDYGLREEVVKFWSWSYTQNGRKYVRGSHNPPTYFYSYLCPPLTTTERLMYWTSVDQCDLSYWFFFSYSHSYSYEDFWVTVNFRQ